MIHFTSDHHFWHANVIRFCDRPYKDVEEMNEALVRNWNEVVKPEDTVYYLGDFAMAFRPVELYTKRLNGRKILIAGNHDWCFPGHKKSNTPEKAVNVQQKYLDAGWEQILIGDCITIGDKVVNMSHFPYKGDVPDTRFDDYRIEDEGDWLLCGHVHDSWQTKGKMINVGCDVWDYKPVSIDTIRDIINGSKK